MTDLSTLPTEIPFKQAAEAAGVSVKTLTSAVAEGRLRVCNQGAHRRVHRADLDAYMRGETLPAVRPVQFLRRRAS